VIILRRSRLIYSDQVCLSIDEFATSRDEKSRDVVSCARLRTGKMRAFGTGFDNDGDDRQARFFEDTMRIDPAAKEGTLMCYNIH